MPCMFAKAMNRNHMRFPIGDGEQIYNGIKTTRVHIRMNNCLLKTSKGLGCFYYVDGVGQMS